jgi:hypothetical protein
MIDGSPIMLTTLRADVVLKTILRLLRKTLLNEFNHRTNYIKRKRHNDRGYILDCLREFTDQIKNKFQPEITTLPSNEEIILFMGSIFYPKEMMNNFKLSH